MALTLDPGGRREIAFCCCSADEDTEKARDGGRAGGREPQGRLGRKRLGGFGGVGVGVGGGGGGGGGGDGWPCVPLVRNDVGRHELRHCPWGCGAWRTGDGGLLTTTSCAEALGEYSTRTSREMRSRRYAWECTATAETDRWAKPAIQTAWFMGRSQARRAPWFSFAVSIELEALRSTTAHTAHSYRRSMSVNPEYLCSAESENEMQHAARSGARTIIWENTGPLSDYTPLNLIRFPLLRPLPCLVV
ncbi:hypothetical protein BDZ91DRAFT_836039 [Kalaharituber pfeilii]|nr:hypothetical protein BDZ91DRAFT_836039 [Kalaharituber pfeilii]